MRVPRVAKLAILFTSASLLAVIHSRVFAQVDDIPDTVIITGSLLPRVREPIPDRARLTQLTDAELRAVLHGAGFREAGDNLHGYSFGCNGDWTHTGAFVPEYGSYSIRNNQYCVQAEVGGSYQYCAKLYRGETGKLFSDVGPPGTASQPALTEVEVTKFSPACPR